MHQILRGGFLDVHVDFNRHPETKLHRRLNLLLYVNKDWKPEYEGYLELWDMKAKRRVENIAPSFNRAVLFETSEVSFHGHPRPLNCPPEITRKSLAVYYFTQTREASSLSPEHNTLYRQTLGLAGYVKTFRAALKAGAERLREQGGAGPVAGRMLKRLGRALKGLPPENE